MPIFYGVANNSRLLARLYAAQDEVSVLATEPQRSPIFLDVARNLGLPPFSTFTRPLKDEGVIANPAPRGNPARVSDGVTGKGRRGRIDGDSNRDPLAPPQPLSAREQQERKKIFRALGLADDGRCRR
jgi:hypothetical protein